LTFLLFLNRVSYELAIILIEINGTKTMATQVKSKQRVAQFGEVLTGKEIVNDMLDLVVWLDLAN